MSEVLEEAIEEGETERGRVEFKLSLDKETHLSGEKKESLVAQMKHRVLSGEGVAQYVIGVTDDGRRTGLSPESFGETVEVISELASSCDCSVESVEQFEADDGLVGVLTIKQGSDKRDKHILVGTAGHVDHGKSTLVGSLVTGTADDGRGKTRSYLDLKPHEIERGLSADLSYAVYGFDKEGQPIRVNDPTRVEEKSKVVEEGERIVSFVDTVGHEPWLRTTIRGIVGQRLDCGLLTVAADEGITETTREHLGILMAAKIPVIVAITKTDTVDIGEIKECQMEIEELMRDVGKTPLPVSEYGIDVGIREMSESVVPIVRTSAVEMEGISELDELFLRMQKKESEEDEGPFEMYVDQSYNVEGVGGVATGAIRSGEVSVGDDLLLGPTESGSYITTRAQSIEIHYHNVDSASSGQIASISLQGVSHTDIERGMILVSDEGKEPEPVREFRAEVMVLNHPTRISDGYEPVVHLETISETSVLSPDESTLLPGDSGEATLRFKRRPYVIEEGQRFVFREGNAKGVGTVISTTDT